MKKRNVFLSVILQAIIVMAVCSGCPVSNPENPENSENPNTTGYFILKSAGYKSLYVSDMKVQGSARAVGDNSGLQTLTYINAAGQNNPVYFISPSGKTIVLEVTKFQRIDEQRTLVSFDSYYEISETQTELNGQKVTAYVLGDQVFDDWKDMGNGSWLNIDLRGSRALIDWSSGKVYDFKDQGFILFAQDGNLYTYTGGSDVWMNNSTLYKINLNTMSNAVPLNNSSFYPVNGLYAPIVLNNKIISRGYSFDINLDFQPQQLKPAMVTIDENSYTVTFGKLLNDYSSGRGLLIQDLEGSYWFFNVYGFHMVSSDWYIGLSVSRRDWDYTSEPYIICKPAIDNTGQMSVSESSSGTLSFHSYSYQSHHAHIFFFDSVKSGIAQIIEELDIQYGNNNVNPLVYRNNGVLIAFEEGFVRISKKAQGLQVDSTALNLPTNLNALSCFINKDNYLYWLEGTAIKRLYLGAGSTNETVYSNSRIVSSSTTDKTLLTASGSNLIFYQVAEDNISVHTYSLPMYQPGTQPKILSTSDVQVRDIVELDF